MSLQEVIAIVILVLQILILTFLLWKKSRPEPGEIITNSFEKFDRMMRQEFYIGRDEFSRHSKELRNEVQSQFRTFSEIISRNITENGDQLKLSFKTLEETLRNNLKDINESMRQKLDNNNVTISELSKSISTNLDKIRDTLQTQLRLLQEDNSKKLEEMRNTVDEKLQSTLEKRLSESFKQVSERLELVHKGLGEMQMLANGVGDLKKVLSNVKTRGILGEVQLENILEQILTKDQYVKNVVTRPDCRENVEFAIKLPGKDEGGKEILLPLDAKFPLESYYSLLEAYDSADNSCIQSSIKALEITIKKVAKDIRDKYIEPPHTTDFGIMFLPVEGLYAEVVRRTDLLEILQRDYKIIITGPTTLAAILHSLQMGFRTLAIEKRSSEVWKVLSAVKTEFGKFNDVLKKAQEKINRASEDIDNLVGTRSRQIQNKLKNITTLPVEESSLLLSDKTENNDDSEEENS